MAHEILIVDDEPDIRMLIEGILSDEGYETRVAASADTALAAFRARRPSLVILDVWLQGSDMDGLAILQAMKAEEPSVPVVMISGHGTIETAVAALQHGAYDFIEKPFQADRLLVIVRRALEASRLARENEELRIKAGQDTELYGNSAQIAAVRNQIEKVAPTGSRVLISGGPGSGKEVAARMIHARSKRKMGPLLRLTAPLWHRDGLRKNCSGLKVARKVWAVAQGFWNVRMVARCCWMKWQTCRWKRRARL